MHLVSKLIKVKHRVYLLYHLKKILFVSNLKSLFGQAILPSKHMTWHKKGWCYDFLYLLELHSVKGQLSQEARSIPQGPCCLEKFSWRQDAFAWFHSTAPNRPGAWMHFCICGSGHTSRHPSCICVCVCFINILNVYDDPILKICR